MTHAPGSTLATVNLGAPDPAALARCYQRLRGWEISAEEPHRVSATASRRRTVPWIGVGGGGGGH